jgi:hypothetical protein
LVGSEAAPDEEGEVLLAPPAALLLGEDGVDELGEPLVEPLALAPPDAESFFVESADEELDEDGEDGELGVVAEPEAELEPDAGELGEVLEPADEDEPEPGVVAERLVSTLSPQAASMLAPNAMEIATARVLSLISGPPWVGVKVREQDSGPYD